MVSLWLTNKKSTMKKTLILLSIITFAVIACQKDPQEKLCDGIICLNGGTCVNGECECPPQYTGPKCAQEVDPIKMKVSKIKITDFPPTASGGSGWDTFDGADVYLEILKGGVSVYESGYVENLTTDYEWTVNFEFSDPTATYVIQVLDYDFGLTTDDFIGGLSFTPYRPGENFPTSYSIGGCSGCVVFFDFNGVTYFH